jgi:hypothetical protein
MRKLDYINLSLASTFSAIIIKYTRQIDLLHSNCSQMGHISNVFLCHPSALAVPWHSMSSPQTAIGLSSN